MRGIETRQGAHHVAQKSTTVTRPFSMDARPFPSSNGNETTAAAAPSFGPREERPRAMATTTTAAAAKATSPHRRRSAERDGPAGIDRYHAGAPPCRQAVRKLAAATLAWQGPR